MEPLWLPMDTKSEPLGHQILPVWEPDGATREPKEHEASKHIPKATKKYQKNEKNAMQFEVAILAVSIIK